MKLDEQWRNVVRKNKIYWKNLIWNYTTRLRYCWKYRNSSTFILSKYYKAKRYITEHQKQQLMKKLSSQFQQMQKQCEIKKLRGQKAEQNFNNELKRQERRKKNDN